MKSVCVCLFSWQVLEVRWVVSSQTLTLWSETVSVSRLWEEIRPQWSPVQTRQSPPLSTKQQDDPLYALTSHNSVSHTHTQMRRSSQWRCCDIYWWWTGVCYWTDLYHRPCREDDICRFFLFVLILYHFSVQSLSASVTWPFMESIFSLIFLLSESTFVIIKPHAPVFHAMILQNHKHNFIWATERNQDCEHH